ncbi:SpoVR like protein, partial [Desulforamulus putei DSM 12395]
MVINSDPCYAFLLEGNTIIQNKMVAAHVLAHCDFFKNNVYFSHTNLRDIIESMAVAADRFRRYEMLYGQEKVEAFVDAVMSVQEHIDPHRMMKRKEKSCGKKENCCGEKP